MHTSISFCQTALKLEKQMDLRDSDLKNSLKINVWPELSSLATLGISLFSIKAICIESDRAKAIY